MARKREWPMGAEMVEPGLVSFRVWAPRAGRVVLDLEARGECVTLDAEGDGWFRGECEARAGAHYRYVLDGHPFPDPASRYQPRGPHGPSEVVDARSFGWTDSDWRGLDRGHQVFYELHVGTFTEGGSWRDAAEQLPSLAEIGITVIELMPVAEFAGNFGWGYDGVCLFAPSHLYGEPDDFRAFVDTAHRLGLGVVLDVVYNHFGPDGNYLKEFTDTFFTDRHKNEWGEAINFDGPGSGPVREFFRANAACWIRDFHLDGFRIDAPQGMTDHSPVHILREIAEAARTAAGARRILLVTENEPQWSHLVRGKDRGGFGLDAQWNDDFERCAMVALTGRREAYYRDYFGHAQEFVSLFKRGFLYQGQRSMHQDKRRGTWSGDVDAAQFVNFLQNHDQVANSVHGRRSHQDTSRRRWRALTAVLLLAPGTPLLFQGQEFAASAPFLFFSDAKPELRKEVHEGRRDFLSQFASMALPAIRADLPAPHHEETFRRCKLDHAEREAHHEAVALHRDLLALRRNDARFARQDASRLDGSPLNAHCFVIRFFGDPGDLLLVVNLGADLCFEPAPEPLLAPRAKGEWNVIWTSEDPRYGGSGTPPPETDGGWWIQGEVAMVLEAER